MSSAAGAPCYVVISPGFEGKDAQPLQWLGRFVHLPETPSAKFAPFGIDLRSTLHDFIMSPVTDSNAVAFSKTIQNNKLSSDLLSLIGLGRASAANRGLEVQASKIATFTLCQYERVLESLLNVPEVRKEVLDLLRASKRKAYMIVGVKVLYTGAIDVRKSSTASHNASINVPVAEIAALTAGLPLPLLGLGDVGVKFYNSKAHNSEAHYEIVNRRIFALEYRVVTFGKSLIRRLSMDPTVSTEAPKYKFGNQVFGDDDGSEDGDDDDDDDDVDVQKGETQSDAVQEAEGELLLNEAPIKLADVNDGLGYETSTYGLVDKNDEQGRASEEAGIFIHQLSDD